MDHESKINIVSRKTYEKGKWPIDVNHSWVLWAVNNERGKLYGACPIVKTKIGDMEVELTSLCRIMGVNQSFLVNFT
jgi:hypothetical protein